MKESLFDPLTGYYVAEISAREARDMVKKYHYSGKVVSNSKIHLGVFENRQLVGCLQYGPPMNGSKTLARISSGVGMELNRMVMRDDQPRNSESAAIGACNRFLRKNYNIDWLLSFSDGKQGNVGYIYQATNWIYLGYILSDSFYDLDGDIVHNVTVWHRYKEKHPLREFCTTDQILCGNFENVSRITCKQHVYVFKLNKKVKFNFEGKAYPKKDREVNILRRKWIKRNGMYHPFTETFSNEELEPIW